MRQHFHEITVIGFHLDMYQHVNNARYLEFLEEARWYYYKPDFESGKFEGRGWAFFIVNININYRSAAQLGEVLVVETRLKEIKNASMILSQVITNKHTQKKVVDAELKIVVVNQQTKKPTPIKGELKDILTIEWNNNDK